MKISFKHDKAGGEILAEWWKELQQNSGARARLRRCKKPEEVILEPEFHRLLKRFYALEPNSDTRMTERDICRIAAIAGLLAHVTSTDSQALAERMADQTRGRPLLSSLRFRRLLKEPFEEFYPAMIRVIRQLDKKVNIYDLGESVFYWGDRVRKRWALAYFPKVVD